MNTKCHIFFFNFTKQQQKTHIRGSKRLGDTYEEGNPVMNLETKYLFNCAKFTQFSNCQFLKPEVHEVSSLYLYSDLSHLCI